MDTTIGCIGLKETPTETVYQSEQEMVKSGLYILQASRLRSRDGKPGLVKIRFGRIDEKINALRFKRNLRDNGYRGTFIRSSMSHTDRIMQQNFQTILKSIPNGNDFRVAANGKIVPAPSSMGA